jgi:hypothetical protein
MLKGTPHLAVGIADLQTPGKNGTKRGAGNDTHLAGLGNCFGQLPGRNARSHSALDNFWI